MCTLAMEITVKEKYDQALNVTGKREALNYFKECVEHAMLFGMSKVDAIKEERKNIIRHAQLKCGEKRQKEIAELYIPTVDFFD